MDTLDLRMKYKISAERIEGLEMYRLRIWNWEGKLVKNVTFNSEQGARIALMNWNYKYGSNRK